MRITEPSQLRETRQIVPTEQLYTLADKWGFDVQNKDKGSSHSLCVSRQYPDIIFAIIRGTNRLSSQRNLADAMKEIARRDKEKAQQLQSSFTAVSENRLTLIREQLPPHITAELAVGGFVVLRDVQLPQIGVTLYSPEEDRLLENKIHNVLEPLKRSLYIELNKLWNKYDAKAHFDDSDTFTGRLTHLVYGDDFSVTLPPYEEGGDPGDAFLHLQNYVQRIEDKDLEQAIRKEELLAKPFIGGVLITHSEQRGERKNRIQIADPRAGNLNVTFATFSHQRVAGDGSRGRISDQDLAFLEWRIGDIEKRIAAAAAKDEPRLQAA